MMESLAWKEENTITPPVCAQDKLTLDALQAVLDGSIAAIRVTRFYFPSLCRLISQKLQNHSDRGAYNKASSINRIGMAHYEVDTPERSKKYHDQALANIWRLREAFSPYLSPVDKIRLLLEEVWPAGAELQTLYGKKCFVGICRIIDPKIPLLAHTDRLDRDSPDSLQAHSLQGQLSACVYLQMPDEGGGLQLWMKEPESEAEYDAMKGGDYGVSREKLGPPMHVIEPEQGDLLIFDIRKYHGVAPGKGKSRINVGTFIGYRGVHHPLSYWS